MHDITGDFEKLYLCLRQKEGRVYSDEEVAQLPGISPDHPHYHEWQLRKKSSRRLIACLTKKKQPLSILEIGCGNGWLSARLASIPGSRVIGTDINFTEVQQAARVFSQVPNLHFICGGPSDSLFDAMHFDIIVFAASIQYFASVAGTIQKTLPLLKPGGEIHIIDSHFYRPAQVNTARQRSRAYYEEAGFPVLAGHYFHHSLDQLTRFNATILYHPNKGLRRFFKNRNPFYWICIQQ